MTAEKEDRRYEWLLSFLSKDVDYGGYDNDHDDDAMVMLKCWGEERSNDDKDCYSEENITFGD